MADLLGSILGSMQKPPSLGAEERRKAKAQREVLEKQQRIDKKLKQTYREKTQNEIHAFIQDSSKEHKRFEPLDKVYRTIIHEVADVAGLTAFSFGFDEQDRYVMLWKKEFAPSDEELQAYREGKVWDPVQAKLQAEQKKLQETDDKVTETKAAPTHNYHEKYEHLIGLTAAKGAAKSTVTKRSYGFVSSENKRDQRTIEQVMADSKARKLLKTDSQSDVKTDSQSDVKTDSQSDVKTDSQSDVKTDSQSDVKTDNQSDVKTDSQSDASNNLLT